jgi:hypothetical protein
MLLLKIDVTMCDYDLSSGFFYMFEYDFGNAYRTMTASGASDGNG